MSQFQSVLPPGSLPLNFKLQGIEPTDDPEWKNATDADKKRFWKNAAAIAMEVKQRELSQGLDFAGRPLRPVRARTLRYKSGAILDGDPLMPHRAMSRTRRLLRYIVHRSSVTFYWAMGWGKILDYHRRGAVLKRNGEAVGRLPVRNVFGISQQGRNEIKRRAIQSWKSNTTPRRPIHPTMQPEGVGVQVPFDPIKRTPKTQEDWLAVGVKTVRYEAKNRTVNKDTGLAGAVRNDLYIWTDPLTMFDEEGGSYVQAIMRKAMAEKNKP